MTEEYNIYDLGFDKNVSKHVVSGSPETLNSFSEGVSVDSLGALSSGEYLSDVGDVAFQDGDNIEITGGHITGTSITIGSGDSSFNVSSGGSLWMGAETYNIATNPFAVSSQGVMKAASGMIANWTISPSALSTGSFDSSGQMYFGSSGLSLSNTFKVTPVGNITATSGNIGGFTLASNSIYGGTIKTSSTVQAGSTGVIMDTAGLRGYDSVLGTVFNLPTDGSAPTFSSGIINSTVFNITESSVIRTSETVGDGTVNSAGILINNTGIYGCAINQTLAAANVRILTDGTAVIEANIRGGQTDYATGTGYFIGLSGGSYKLSVGDDDNHLRWDGTYLKIKGSFDVGSSGVINNAVYTVANLPVAATTVGFETASGNE